MTPNDEIKRISDHFGRDYVANTPGWYHGLPHYITSKGAVVAMTRCPASTDSDFVTGQAVDGGPVMH